MFLNFFVLLFLTLGSTTTAQQEVNGTFMIGFIYFDQISDLGWTFRHDEGRLYITDLFPNVYTNYVENIDLVGVLEIARNWMYSGYGLIVGTSFNHQFGLYQAAQEAEEAGLSVKFLAMTGYLHRSNMANAMGKIYQSRYITGILSGYMTKTKEMCYIGAYSDQPEVIYGINAFTIGVQQIVPDVKMYVYIINTWGDPDLEEYSALKCFSDHPNVDIITQHSDNTNIQQVARDEGVYSVGYDSDMRIFVGESVLSSNIFNWGPMYAIITESILNNTWVPDAQFFLGMAQGIVDIADLSNKVPRYVKNVILQKKAEITSGQLEVFCGKPVQDGRFGNLTNNCLSDNEILNMLTFVDGVIDEGNVSLPLPTENYVVWSDPVAITISIITTIWLLYGITVLSLTSIKYNHPSIMGISYLFCLFMQTSALLASIAIFLWIGRPTSTICNLRVWLLSIGFIVFYGCLFAKSWRVWKIFSRAKKLKLSQPLTDTQLLIFIGMFLVVEFIILILFTTLSPLQPTLISNPYIPDSNDVICDSDHSSAFVIILILYKAMLVLLGTLMAFLTRGVDKKFRESKEMYWTIYTILLINLIILPLVFFLDMSAQNRFLLVAVDILWILFFSFSVLFAKRIYIAFTVSPDQVKRPNTSTVKSDFAGSTTG